MSTDEIVKAFEEIKNRSPIIFLDYDGTLVKIVMDPDNCYADEELRGILSELRKKYETYIVTGRSMKDIRKFIGMDYNIVALHGATWSINSTKVETVEGFERCVTVCNSIYGEREKYISLYPGLRIYNKDGGVLFHLGLVKNDSHKEEVVSLVEGLAKKHEMAVYRGKMIVELRVPGVNKGKTISRIREGSRASLIAGDDRTDEESFRYNMDALKIRVGDGDSLADFKVRDYKEMREILRKLCA